MSSKPRSEAPLSPELDLSATAEDVRALRQARERSRRDFDWSWVTAFDELVPESRRRATAKGREPFRL